LGIFLPYPGRNGSLDDIVQIGTTQELPYLLASWYTIREANSQLL
jgi:hypothetical protein